MRRIAHRKRPPYPVKPVYAGFCNSKKLLKVLNGISPDYILMMDGGILSEEIFKTAKKGVLNAHPGLLPWIRGLDVCYHALLRGYPLGVTEHFIDVGIDTGEIISRHLLPVRSEDKFTDVTDRAECLCVAAMLNAV